MIGYIKGKVLSFGNGIVLLENNGIGYEIACSASSYRALTTDSVGAVYTYLAVKEDGLNLYGFSSPTEKDMFLRLISVSGVGPKMGIAILSGMSLTDLALAITAGDVKALSSIKGLGKKTAERIILELKSSVELPSGEASVFVEAASGIENDAVSALIGLGYSKAESLAAVKRASASGAKGLSELIQVALRSFSNL